MENGKQQQQAPKGNEQLFNGREMIARNNKKKTKFHYNDRMKVRITRDVKRSDGSTRWKKGKILDPGPHRLMAEQMIIDGFAEEVRG